MPHRTIEERYKNEPEFHAAVNAIKSMINEKAGLTPLDIRDAAYLARLIYERNNVRPIIISSRWTDNYMGLE